MNAYRYPLKILYLNDYLHGMGGAERNLIQTLEGIDRCRFSPVVCCLSGGELALELKNNGNEVYNLNVKRIYGLNGLKKLVWLIRFIKQKRVRLIVSYHESSDWMGLIAAKFSGIPIISNRRDMGYKLKYRHLFIYKLCNKYFDRIIAVSDAVKNVIATKQKVPIEKIITIPNGVDTTLFSNTYDNIGIRRSLGISEHEFVIGIIAGLRKIKGHIYFIQAASKVIKEFRNVKYLIIGKDFNEPGCSKKELMDAAFTLGVSDNIIFTGERKDIPELLSVVDIVVNPSLSEGMSNTLLEAMATEKTVIASNVGGNPHIISDKENGFLFPPEDADKLAKIIVNCLKEPNRTKAMRQKARITMRDHFDVTLMCKRNMALYMECIDCQSYKNAIQTVFHIS